MNTSSLPARRHFALRNSLFHQAVGPKKNSSRSWTPTSELQSNRPTPWENVVRHLWDGFLTFSLWLNIHISLSFFIFKLYEGWNYMSRLLANHSHSSSCSWTSTLKHMQVVSSIKHLNRFKNILDVTHSCIGNISIFLLLPPLRLVLLSNFLLPAAKCPRRGTNRGIS